MALGSITISLLMATGSFETDTKKAEKRLAEMSGKAKAAGKVIGTALAGAFTAAGAAAISWTNDVVRTAEDVERLATLTGTSTETFQRWAAGASLARVEQDKLADMLKDTRERVGEFLRSGGGEMADFFENIAPKVGVTADQFARLSGPEAMQLYVDSLEKAGVSQNEMVAYMEAMASDASLLIPLLQDNGKAMREAGDAAADLGAIMDRETIQAAKAMRASTWALEQSFMGLKVEVAQELMPQMEDFAEFLSGPEVQSGVATMVGGLLQITQTAIQAASAFANFVRDISEDLAALAHGVSADDFERQAQKISALVKARSDVGTGALDFRSEDALSAERAALDKQIATLRAEYANNLKLFGPKVTTITGAPGSTTPTSILKPEVLALPGYTPTGGGAGNRIEKTKELTEAEKAYQDVMEVNAEIDQMAAERQTELVIAEGNRLFAKMEAIAATDDFIGSLKRENELIGATNLQLEIEAALRYAGADATDEQKRNIIDLITERDRELEQLDTQIETMDAVRDSARGFFDDISEGVKPIDALTDAVTQLGDKLLDLAMDEMINGMFGKQGKAGGGWMGALVDGFIGFFGGAQGKAGGGYIAGAGTATSDSIPAYLSNGEYVINASAVSQYGKSFFDGLNAKRFAAGGYVGGAAPAGAGPGVNLKVEIINKGEGMKVERQETTTGPDGQKVLRVMVRNMVKGDMAGGEFDGVMGQSFGLKRQGYANG